MSLRELKADLVALQQAALPTYSLLPALLGLFFSREGTINSRLVSPKLGSVRCTPNGSCTTLKVWKRLAANSSSLPELTGQGGFAGMMTAHARLVLASGLQRL